MGRSEISFSRIQAAMMRGCSVIRCKRDTRWASHSYPIGGIR